MASDLLYRRTFVGRSIELSQLQNLYDRAVDGDGALAFVVGEPGIGKTALTEQLGSYVSRCGGKALVGHCYEEGSLSLPYLAFIETMQAYARQLDDEGLRSELGAAAADVARIVPDVADRLTDVELRPKGDPESDRWRLLQGVLSFLRNASASQPLLIVLEDLHWADRGTLDLLLHIARNLQGARVLIVGTYRDVEVDRSHPLSAALAEMGRAGNFQRLRPRGLTIDEVQGMIASALEREVARPFAELIHQQTEGSPLFVQEMLRYLIEEGLVSEHDGVLRLGGDESLAGRTPEGLRDVIGRRLSRLSSECNRLLAIAAIIGRDFRLDTLRTVSGTEENALVTALEEATRVGVLEETARTGVITYRFTHAFFRQMLYEELSAPRRLRFHQEVARVLEAQYASRRQEHAAELAEHFANSTDRADLTKAVEYGELAAERAMSVFDYGEASRLLEKSIDVQEVLDPDDAVKRYHLLLALGEALMPAGENYRVIETVAPAALALAVGLKDDDRSSAACTLAIAAISRAQINMAEPLSLGWALKADQFARQENIGRVDADIAMGRSIALVRGSKAQAWQFLQRALTLARKLRDREAVISASLAILGFAANSHWDPGRGSDVRQLAEALAEEPLEEMSSQTKASVSSQLGRVLLSIGERTRAETIWGILPELARRTQDASIISLLILREARLAETDGQLEAAVAAFRKITAQSEALGLSDAVTSLFQIRALTHLGRANEALALARDNIKQFENSSSAYRNSALLAFCLANAASHNEAQAAMNVAFADIQPNGETSVSDLVWVLEASLLLGERAVAAALAPQLHAVRDSLTCRNPVSIARLLGEASFLLMRPEDARNYYTEGLELCERVRFRPEIALMRLDLAELLLKHYPDERAEAIEQLDFVIPEFTAMKMQPALERALRLRGRRRPAVLPQNDGLPDRLSEREVEVLKLIAEGRTNPQIADKLVISRSTVQNHVSNILTKAGLANRAEAAAYAERHNLT